MLARGANFFREQISPDFRPLGGGFYPSRSVVENMCLIGHPGTHYGIKILLHPEAGMVWLTLPRNDLFVLGDGLSDCQRPEEKEAVIRHITKKCGSPFHDLSVGRTVRELGFRRFYFQSLKISSNAISRAAFILLFRIANISASRVDFFFFFLSLSFFYWLILS